MRNTIAAAVLSAILAIPMTGAAANLAPGAAAPTFELTDTDGNTHRLADYLGQGRIVVLEWFNPDCPFIVKHHQTHRTMNETFAAVAYEGVIWLAINSSAPGKQGHGLQRNRRAVEEYDISFPVLIDEDGAVGRSYGAKTTPHMFVITPDGKVAYNGAIDDDRSAGKLGETNHVAEALTSLLDGKPVKTASTKPYGCSVKYAK